MTTTRTDEAARLEAAAAVAPGTLLAWGRNGSGQLGDGTTTNRALPTPVPNLTGVTALAEGSGHTLAVLSNGTVRAWGDNGNGELGDGTKTGRSTPAPVPGLAGVVAVTAGSAHSLALLADGRLFAWGRNIQGQLGIGSSGGDQLTPVQVQNLGLSRVKALAAGDNFTLVLLADGTVLSCGSNSNGELGDGTNTKRSTLAPVQNLIPSKAIAAGRRHGMALTSNGGIRAWGDNNDGQLGNGSTTDSKLPTSVNTDSLNGPVIAVACGGQHSLALMATGGIKGWGKNSEGQLGNNSNSSPRVFPVSTAPGAEGAIAIDAGFVHSLALLINGTVRAWGQNSDGQVGDGSTINRAKPMQVSGLVGITAVTAAGNSSFALQ
jgi:alpha-tubulin suppressor-like RCC1 family protein